MKKHTITPTELYDFVLSNEILFASSTNNGAQKRLTYTGFGKYYVYENGEKILSTISQHEAVDKYNELP